MFFRNVFQRQFAGVFVPLVLTLRGDFPQEVFSLKSWHLFAGIALASIANNITYFYALRHTSISNAVFTHYTAPVLVAVLAPFLIAERLQRVTLISLPVAVAGMALIILSSGGLDLNSQHLPGISREQLQEWPMLWRSFLHANSACCT